MLELTWLPLKTATAKLCLSTAVGLQRESDSRVPILITRNNIHQYRTDFQYHYLFLYQRTSRGVKTPLNVGFLKFSASSRPFLWSKSSEHGLIKKTHKTCTEDEQKPTPYWIMKCALIHHRKIYFFTVSFLTWHQNQSIRTSGMTATRPDHTQINPDHTQINPYYTHIKPDHTQINPDHTHINPDHTQINADHAQTHTIPKPRPYPYPNLTQCCLQEQYLLPTPPAFSGPNEHLNSITSYIYTLYIYIQGSAQNVWNADFSSILEETTVATVCALNMK